MESELKRILDRDGRDLWHLAERSTAVDARDFIDDPDKDATVDPFYTLADQLFVEPQPQALPTAMELDAPIRMSRPEIAVARSHIDIWRQIAANAHEYALVLEDDVWFRPRFAAHLDAAWAELKDSAPAPSLFDILYLSYQEVKHGAPKHFLSRNIFRPQRGLWYLSGYVLSREGAKKLLQLLPCRGPVDLWMNHQFGALDTCAVSRSLIGQRDDLVSSNKYSILPSLTRIGAISSEGAALFHPPPLPRPVFAFGESCTGQSSLAMALSMLGYRCCNDLCELPGTEYEALLTGNGARAFDAYVNIGSLEKEIPFLLKKYPQAKLIVTGDITRTSEAKRPACQDAAIVYLDAHEPNKWRVICEHLRCAPPACGFPEFPDMGERQMLFSNGRSNTVSKCVTERRDESPWIIPVARTWGGFHALQSNDGRAGMDSPVRVSDRLAHLDSAVWFPRDDTFTGNLALFRPSNIAFSSSNGAVFTVRQEFLGVRTFSAASLSSRQRFLFGRFEVEVKSSSVSGVITGLFLHRDSPRQEIDIELVGRRPTRLLTNVFYNPGGDGAPFDYGYRGTPTYIDLGFDASKDFHTYAIEWTPHAIRWLVDGRLVHERGEWDPTPIPHLPMTFHVNVWPCRSKEVAGRVAVRSLPASAFVRSVTIEATQAFAPTS